MSEVATAIKEGDIVLQIDDFLHLYALLEAAFDAVPNDTDSDQVRACVRASLDYLRTLGRHDAATDSKEPAGALIDLGGEHGARAEIARQAGVALQQIARSLIESDSQNLAHWRAYTLSGVVMSAVATDDAMQELQERLTARDDNVPGVNAGEKNGPEWHKYTSDRERLSLVLESAWEIEPLAELVAGHLGSEDDPATLPHRAMLRRIKRLAQAQMGALFDDDETTENIRDAVHCG